MLAHLAFLLPLLAAPPTPAPLPPREAAASMTLPPGFKATLFAGEPDVKQPIAFCFDDRGRLWVVECFSYPKWSDDPTKGVDRVIILEDTDGDGQFDKRTLFADKLSNLSGIEYGFGGIWLCSIPNLLYIPIKDDRPAGPPEIKLDGWSMKCGHNVFNSLKWGPDGWLYGLNGILSHSKVGPPGTPEKDRVQLNCGVWRYHPTRKKFEAYAHGTTNPFGLDWDEHGEMFITNCVIAHLWHVVPGAHFERMFGSDFNPHLYGLMKTCADHLHWAGGSWTDSREAKGAHSVAGGGHAHVGCMIYQGDNFPKSYRNAVFMGNLHGNRLNVDLLERKGSTYVARHGHDFLLANDPWFRSIALDYGPDGGVYVSDWCDTGECHNYKVANTETGRIYKIVYGKPKHQKIDLQKLSDEELIETTLGGPAPKNNIRASTNEWMVRHARRILQERAHEKGKAGDASAKWRQSIVAKISQFVRYNTEVGLRALWAMNALGIEDDSLLKLTRVGDSHVRNWAVRLFGDNITSLTDQQFEFILQNARKDPSPRVRLAYACLLQRLSVAQAIKLGRVLCEYHDDSDDPYLPWMIWYGVEPAFKLRVDDGNWPDEPLLLLEGSRISLIRELGTRRFVSQGDKILNPLVEALALTSNPAPQRDMLRGMRDALKGRRTIPMPSAWTKVYAALTESPLAEVREHALELAVQFGDDRAYVALKQIASDANAPSEKRQHALQALLQRQSKDLIPFLQKLVEDSVLRGAAIRSLAAFTDVRTSQLLVDKYANLTDDEKIDAVSTLASRPAYALALLDAVAKKQIPRDDLSQTTVLQLLALNNKDITARVNDVWGTLRPSSQEKTALIAKYKKLLTTKELKNADLPRGRQLYTKNCASCHRLFGEGGAIGPDITGAQRSSLDYLLENIVDPGAVVPREFQVGVVTTTSGRVLTGIVKEAGRAVTVQTPNELVTLPRDEVDSLTPTKNSMMPDGILEPLTFAEIRDLIAYLASSTQVSLTGRK